MKVISILTAFSIGISSALAGVSLNKTPHDHHQHTLILVDKKTNLLHLAHYESDDSYKILKTYHTTTGKVKGDKDGPKGYASVWQNESSEGSGTDLF